jgi:hypothetical protein
MADEHGKVEKEVAELKTAIDRKRDAMLTACEGYEPIADSVSYLLGKNAENHRDHEGMEVRMTDLEKSVADVAPTVIKAIKEANGDLNPKSDFFLPVNAWGFKFKIPGKYVVAVACVLLAVWGWRSIHGQQTEFMDTVIAQAKANVTVEDVITIPE